MQLDPEKFETDEVRSNHLVAAMKYPGCPIDGVCLYIATGGAVIEQCQHLSANGESAECKHQAS